MFKMEGQRMKAFNRILSVGILLSISTFAIASTSGDLASIAKTVTTQANAVAKLLSVLAYVAGVGFAMAGILQLKAHKENPQQVPLSKPVVMIVVAACLLFLPTILTTAGSSIFGSDAKSAAKAGDGDDLSGK